MLDFGELSPDGNDLELLVREILFSLGYTPRWSGKGPDEGRDLLIDEEGEPLFGGKPRRWLVSCKHRQTPTASVGVDELVQVTERCAQHRASGFLLVCSTFPSAGVVSLLEGLENVQQFPAHTHYWDGPFIERMLATPHNWAIAQRFLPLSAARREWRVWATDSPNRFIVAMAGCWFYLSNRITSSVDGHLLSVEARLKSLWSSPIAEGELVRPRAAYYDDKAGAYKWFIDYLVPDGSTPSLTAEELVRRLGGQHTAYEDEQIHSWDVVIRFYSPYSDHHDRDHYRYYEPYIPLFHWGGSRPENQAPT